MTLQLRSIAERYIFRLSWRKSRWFIPIYTSCLEADPVAFPNPQAILQFNFPNPLVIEYMSFILQTAWETSSVSELLNLPVNLLSADLVDPVSQDAIPLVKCVGRSLESPGTRWNNPSGPQGNIKACVISGFAVRSLILSKLCLWLAAGHSVEIFYFLLLKRQREGCDQGWEREELAD